MWKREPLEDDEADRLKRASEQESTDTELTVKTLLHTGMRASEYAHMRADWVNYQREQIRIPAEQDGWTPKSEAGARIIPLKDPDVTRLLRNWFRVNEEIGMSRTTVYRRVTDAAENAAVPKKVTPHVLRHTYGTTIASNGATAAYIKQTMGHGSIKTSQQYIQYSGKRLDDEAAELW